MRSSLRTTPVREPCANPLAFMTKHLSFSYPGSAGLSTFRSTTLRRASLPPCKCDRAIFSGEGEQAGRLRVSDGLQRQSEAHETRRLDLGINCGKRSDRIE